jgi:hypothetical protein
LDRSNALRSTRPNDDTDPVEDPMSTIRRLASLVDSYTLWAFNAPDLLNPGRRG